MEAYTKKFSLQILKFICSKFSLLFVYKFKFYEETHTTKFF